MKTGLHLTLRVIVPAKHSAQQKKPVPPEIRYDYKVQGVFHFNELPSVGAKLDYIFWRECTDTSFEPSMFLRSMTVIKERHALTDRRKGVFSPTIEAMSVYKHRWVDHERSYQEALSDGLYELYRTLLFLPGQFEFREKGINLPPEIQDVEVRLEERHHLALGRIKIGLKTFWQE